ncbi:MAG TPA: glycoside hydrolase family 16 protein [Acidimicrobiales bacterium]|nr:glycoside hydrolase family 16 protein [Acidimicrobiales bacterium]
MVPSSGPQSGFSGSAADASHAGRAKGPGESGQTTGERSTPQPRATTTTTTTTTTASTTTASTSAPDPIPTAPSPTTTSTPAPSSPGAGLPPADPGATTTSTTAPAPSSCGGRATLVSDGSTWTCSFDTEFNGTTLDTSKWTPITTAASGYTSGLVACFVNSPNNISVGNGYLSLTARKEAAPFTCKDPYGSFTTQYTSGTVSTYGLFSQAYGRFEVSAKLPAATVAGLQSSLWLFPQNETKYGAWPASGEIDIAETFSEYPTLAIPYIHYNYTTVNAATDTNVVTNDYCTIDPTKFNDYVVEWTPSSITMLYNGHTCLVDHWIPAFPESGPQPFDQPFFINLTQALGIGTNNFNPSTTPLPATSKIKYVRAWQLHS